MSSSDDDDDAPALLPPVAPFRPPPTSLSAAQTVGVTLLTGFLGSGKSTLIRRILSSSHGKRILVVENEFGDRVSSSIESAIITPASPTDADLELISLPNGCVCCSASADMTSSLARLLRSGAVFDNVIIEVSGLADPVPVAAKFWVDDALETMLRLDAVVAVVDAGAVLGSLENGEGEGEGDRRRLAEKQIACADVVLLNKTDLAGKEGLPALAEVRAVVEGLAQEGVSVLETERCQVELNKILNVGAYSFGGAKEKVAARLGADTVHVRGVVRVSVVFEEVCFDERKLDRAFGELLWDEGGEAVTEIWRGKALVAVEGKDVAVLYQAVGKLYEGEDTDIRWSTENPRLSRFVFIGRGLDEKDLRRRLEIATVGVDKVREA